MKFSYLSIIVISLILIGASNFSIAHVEIPQISISQSNFTDGDIIPINGYALPNSTINIFLVNNYGNIQNSTQVKSNNTGYFNTSLGIPSHVIGGAWALFATNGESNFAMQLMVNFHGSNTPPFNFPSGLPPLKQFKLGIKPSYVQCRSDLQLIIKSEDGSPACVKPEHLTRLLQYGWTIPNLKIIGDTDIINNDGLSESNCGQFHTIPENKSDSNKIPVLILQQNSTGCAKITFTVNSLFNNTNDCVGCNSQMVKTVEFLSIGKYNSSRHGNLLSGSSGKDYTHSFQITAVPKTVDLANFPVGSNFTVMFTIKPLPNATGFYDYSIVKPVCNAYPLAVGYSPDQVNSSDFSEDLGFMQNHPCAMGPYGYSPVQISGMSYVQMKLN